MIIFGATRPTGAAPAELVPNTIRVQAEIVFCTLLISPTAQDLFPFLGLARINSKFCRPSNAPCL